MKLAAIVFFFFVPILSARDAAVVFYERCIEGFDLVRAMWLE